MAESKKQFNDRTEIMSQIRKEIALLKEEDIVTKDIATNISSFLAGRKKALQLAEQINKQKQLEKEIENTIKRAQNEGNILLEDELKLELKGLQYKKKELASLKSQIGLGGGIKALLGSTLSLMNDITGINLKNELGWQGIIKYLIESDKVIKDMNLKLGLSGTRAQAMSDSFQRMTNQITTFGGRLEDLVSLQETYADITGRVRLMSDSARQSVVEIGKGTGLGVKRGSQLAAQFENIGVDAVKSLNLVQNVVDTSERMGLNTQKILDNVIDSFKQSQRFYFKRGVNALAEMAIHSTKFKQDISESLAATEKFRGLEGAVEGAAQLRLIGGEAAKLADPLAMLFEARNAPEKFQERLKGMTKDLAIFDKSIGQVVVTSVGLDQLRIMADATGQSIENLQQTAIRTKEIDMMQNQIPGFIKMDKQLKESIEGVALLDSKTGKFNVTINGQSKDISKLTDVQAKQFLQEQKSLKERAEASRSFSDSWKDMIETIKAAFLPLIKGLNWITNIIQSATEGVSWLGKSLVMAFTIGIPALLMFGGKFISTFLTMKAMTLGLGKNIGDIATITTKMPKGGLFSSLFGGMSAGGMLKGALAVAVLGASLVPFAYAMTLLKDVGWKQFGLIAAGIGLMTGAVIGLGAVMATGFGAAAIVLGAGAIALMGASLLPLAYSMKELGEANIPDIGFGFKTLSSSVNAIDSSKLEELRKTAESLKNLSATSGIFNKLNNLFAEGIEVKFKDNQVKMVANVTALLDKDVLVKKLSEPISVEIESGNAFLQRKIGG